MRQTELSLSKRVRRIVDEFRSKGLHMTPTVQSGPHSGCVGSQDAEQLIMEVLKVWPHVGLAHTRGVFAGDWISRRMMNSRRASRPAATRSGHRSAHQDRLRELRLPTAVQRVFPSTKGSPGLGQSQHPLTRQLRRSGRWKDGRDIAAQDQGIKVPLHTDPCELAEHRRDRDWCPAAPVLGALCGAMLLDVASSGPSTWAHHRSPSRAKLCGLAARLRRSASWSKTKADRLLHAPVRMLLKPMVLRLRKPNGCNDDQLAALGPSHDALPVSADARARLRKNRACGTVPLPAIQHRPPAESR